MNVFVVVLFGHHGKRAAMIVEASRVKVILCRSRRTSNEPCAVAHRFARVDGDVTLPVPSFAWGSRRAWFRARVDLDLYRGPGVAVGISSGDVALAVLDGHYPFLFWAGAPCVVTGVSRSMARTFGRPYWRLVHCPALRRYVAAQKCLAGLGCGGIGVGCGCAPDWGYGHIDDTVTQLPKNWPARSAIAVHRCSTRLGSKHLYSESASGGAPAPTPPGP